MVEICYDLYYNSVEATVDLCSVFTPTIYLFSFGCGTDYHAPTSCDTIKRWLTKCVDDSETANYISANTKDVRNWCGAPCVDRVVSVCTMHNVWDVYLCFSAHGATCVSRRMGDAIICSASSANLTSAGCA